MNNVTSIGIAERRKKDIEMIESLDWQLKALHESERRVLEMRRELVNRLGLNKPD